MEIGGNITLRPLYPRRITTVPNDPPIVQPLSQLRNPVSGQLPIKNP